MGRLRQPRGAEPAGPPFRQTAPSGRGSDAHGPHRLHPAALRAPGIQHLALGPLDAASAAELMRRTAGAPASQSLRDVVAVAAGNPRHIIAMVTALARHDGLRIIDGRTETAASASDRRSPAAPLRGARRSCASWTCCRTLSATSWKLSRSSGRGYGWTIWPSCSPPPSGSCGRVRVQPLWCWKATACRCSSGTTLCARPLPEACRRRFGPPFGSRQSTPWGRRTAPNRRGAVRGRPVSRGAYCGPGPRQRALQGITFHGSPRARPHRRRCRARPGHLPTVRSGLSAEIMASRSQGAERTTPCGPFTAWPAPARRPCCRRPSAWPRPVPRR